MLPSPPGPDKAESQGVERLDVEAALAVAPRSWSGSESCAERNFSRRSWRSSTPGFGASSRPTPTPTSRPTPSAVSAGATHSLEFARCSPTSSSRSSRSSFFRSLSVSMEVLLSGRRGIVSAVAGESGDGGPGQAEELLLHQGDRRQPDPEAHHAEREPTEEPTAEHVTQPQRGSNHPVRMTLHAATEIDGCAQVLERAARFLQELLRAVVQMAHAADEPLLLVAVSRGRILRSARHGGWLLTERRSAR